MGNPDYVEPPIRNRAPFSAGIFGGAGILAVIGILVLALSAIPHGKGSGGSDKGGGKGHPAAAPIVPFTGAQPCELSTAQKNAACASAKAYAQTQLKQKKMPEQFGCLDTLWVHESNWNAWSRNTKFADVDLQAIGIPQMIPKYHGHPFELGEWQKQVDWGLNYIYGRYGTPCAAWAWWQHPGAAPFDENWY